MTVQRIEDKDVLHQYFVRDRIASAYQLADLDGRYWGYCRWWGHTNERSILDAVVMLYTGLRTPVLLTSGDAEGVGQIVDTIYAELPSQFFGQVHGHQLGALQGRINTENLSPRIRMGLHRSDYYARPLETDERCVVLSHADTADLMRLYQHYPDNFFEPYQLETGYYVGLREEGQLVSIAGVHTVSPAYKMAVVGNIVTHPDFRSQGLGRVCTAAVLNLLFERVALVALNVTEENVASRKMCRRLGFADHLQFYEGMIVKR